MSYERSLLSVRVPSVVVTGLCYFTSDSSLNCIKDSLCFFFCYQGLGNTELGEELLFSS